MTPPRANPAGTDGPEAKHIMMRTFQILLLLLLLGACVHPAVPVEDAKVASIRTVGVVSAIGDTFRVNDRSIPIEPWGIDQAVIDKIAALLGSRFQVVPVTYQKPAFTNPRGRPLADVVRTEVSPQGLDAYIIVNKISQVLPPLVGGFVKYGTFGLSIVDTSTLLVTFVTLSAAYGITIVDGHQLTVIGGSPALVPTKVVTGEFSRPIRAVDKSWLPSSPVMSDAESQRLKDAVWDLIDKSLPLTLHELKMAQ